MTEYRSIKRKETGAKIDEVFKIIQSMHRDLDDARWRLNKRIKEIQEEQKKAKEEFILHKAEIVSLLSEVWEEVDPMEKEE